MKTFEAIATSNGTAVILASTSLQEHDLIRARISTKYDKIYEPCTINGFYYEFSHNGTTWEATGKAVALPAIIGASRMLDVHNI